MAFQFTQTGQELQYLIDEVTQLAGDYDPTASYAIDDYCTYEGVVYRCTAATTGTFDAADWTSSVIVMDAIKALKARMTTAEGDITTLQTSVGNQGKSETVTLTAGTGCTFLRARKAKVGNLVSYVLEFSTTGVSTVRSVCLTGLSDSILAAAGFCVADGMNTSTAAAYSFALYSNSGVGEIRNLAALPSGTYRLGITYVAV